MLLQERAILLVTAGLTLASALSAYAEGLVHRSTKEDENKAPALTVRHLDDTVNGWCMAEAPHFRIFHQQSRELVERVALAAERARAATYRKWFGAVGIDWPPCCELSL